MIRILTLALGTTLLLWDSPPATAQTAACPAAPPAQINLAAEPHYDQSRRQDQVVDRAARRRTDRDLAPLRQFSSLIAQMSDMAVRDPRGAMASCMTGLLQNWARQGALLGDAASRQAEYERQWALAGIALATYKLQRSGHAVPGEVLDWLGKLAARVRMERDRSNAANNHASWAALGVGTVAALRNDPDLWRWAQSRADIVIRDIRPDGTVGSELRRRQRATQYHFFTAAPLMALERVARCYGHPFDGADEAALERLVSLLRRLQQDPSLLAGPAGGEQLSPGRQDWLPVLDHGQAAAGGRTELPRLGGDVVALRQVTECR